MTDSVLGGGDAGTTQVDSTTTTVTNNIDGGAGAVNNPGGDGGDSNSSGLDFIPEQFREAPWAAKYKTSEDFFNGIDNMNKMLGKKEIVQGVKVPGEDATDEDWKNFHKEIGAPEEATAYELETEYEDPKFDVSEAAESFRALAHKNGLTQKQAQGLFKDYVELSNQNITQLQEQHKFDPEKVTKDLWGDEAEESLKAAQRGARHLGIADDLDKQGISANPLVLKMAKALGDLVKEGTVKDGGDSTGRSKEELLAEAKKLQQSAEYRTDPSVYKKVEQLYEQVYTQGR